MMFMFLFSPPDHTYKIVAHIQNCDSNLCTCFQSLPKVAWGLLLSTNSVYTNDLVGRPLLMTSTKTQFGWAHYELHSRFLLVSRSKQQNLNCGQLCIIELRYELFEHILAKRAEYGQQVWQVPLKTKQVYNYLEHFQPIFTRRICFVQYFWLTGFQPFLNLRAFRKGSTMPLSFIFIDHLKFMISNMKLLTRTLPKTDGKVICHCLSHLKICTASCPNISGLTLQISCLKHAFVVQPTWLPWRSISLCKNDQFAEWKFLLCSLRPMESQVMRWISFVEFADGETLQKQWSLWVWPSIVITAFPVSHLSTLLFWHSLSWTSGLFSNKPWTFFPY